MSRWLQKTWYWEFQEKKSSWMHSIALSPRSPYNLLEILSSSCSWSKVQTFLFVVARKDAKSHNLFCSLFQKSSIQTVQWKSLLFFHNFKFSTYPSLCQHGWEGDHLGDRAVRPQVPQPEPDASLLRLLRGLLQVHQDEGRGLRAVQLFQEGVPVAVPQRLGPAVGHPEGGGQVRRAVVNNQRSPCPEDVVTFNSADSPSNLFVVHPSGCAYFSSCLVYLKGRFIFNFVLNFSPSFLFRWPLNWKEQSKYISK